MSSACEWEENNGSAAQPGQDGIRKGPITARGGGTLEAHGGLLRRMRSDAGIQEKLVRIGQVHGATCVRYRQRQCGEKDAILGRERRGISWHWTMSSNSKEVFEGWIWDGMNMNTSMQKARKRKIT